MTQSGSQRGAIQVSMVELMVALVVAALVVLVVGFLFTRQARNYSDMEVQARLQSQTKMAIRVMTREISNAGVGLAGADGKMGNNAYPFTFSNSSNPRVKIHYRDLKGRHCGANDSLAVEFRLSTVGSQSALIQRKYCNGTLAGNDTVAKSEAIALGMRYLDRNGSATTTLANVKALECTLTVEAKKTKDLFDRKRRPVFRVRFGTT